MRRLSRGRAAAAAEAEMGVEMVRSLCGWRAPGGHASGGWIGDGVRMGLNFEMGAAGVRLEIRGDVAEGVIDFVVHK